MLKLIIKWLQSLDGQATPSAYPVKPPYTFWGSMRRKPAFTLPVYIGLPNSSRPMTPTDAPVITNLRYRING
jgi:hypothetical protein